MFWNSCKKLVKINDYLVILQQWVENKLIIYFNYLFKLIWMQNNVIKN